jgi:hypothetical protein
LFSHRLEAQRTETYASPLRSLRPRWKTVLNTLQHVIISAIPACKFAETTLRILTRCSLDGRVLQDATLFLFAEF